MLRVDSLESVVCSGLLQSPWNVASTFPLSIGACSKELCRPLISSQADESGNYWKNLQCHSGFRLEHKSRNFKSFIGSLSTYSAVPSSFYQLPIRTVLRIGTNTCYRPLPVQRSDEYAGREALPASCARVRTTAQI